MTLCWTVNWKVCGWCSSVVGMGSWLVWMLVALWRVSRRYSLVWVVEDVRFDVYSLDILSWLPCAELDDL
jgi:hypothetical protein